MIVAPAITSVTTGRRVGEASLAKKCRPTAKVNLSLLRRKINGLKKSFHVHRNEKIATAASAGVIMGRTISPEDAKPAASVDPSGARRARGLPSL